MNVVTNALCQVEDDASYLAWLVGRTLKDDKPTTYAQARLSVMELQAGRVVQAVALLKDALASYHSTNRRLS